jgi:hypothetical protein
MKLHEKVITENLAVNGEDGEKGGKSFLPLLG